MINTDKPKVIVICGPTGIGKTNLSLMLAQEFRGAIVSADSMQIYKYMDIGTAKATIEERSVVPHYMIDITTPDSQFDAAEFVREARESISKIREQRMVPFVVGGTGFYIKALLNGLCRAKPVDPTVRQQLKTEAITHGSKFLYERLSLCDPEAAARIHPNDSYRIIRALEIYEVTRKPMTEYQKEHAFMDRPYSVLKICLFMPRDELYGRINQRVDRMIEDGILDEVKKLIDMGFSEGLAPMNAIGYRHMVNYIKDRVSWDETVRILKRDTRRYAKRQLTWFQKDNDMIFKSPYEFEEIMSLTRRFLQGSD